jgi:hypothetical protein
MDTAVRWPVEGHVLFGSRARHRMTARTEAVRMAGGADLTCAGCALAVVAREVALMNEMVGGHRRLIMEVDMAGSTVLLGELIAMLMTT